MKRASLVNKKELESRSYTGNSKLTCVEGAIDGRLLGIEVDGEGVG